MEGHRYRIGYHVSTAGSLSLAFDRARALGCTSMQIFMSNPRGWLIKIPIKEDIAAFRGKSSETGISPVFAHMPYLPNLASPREAVRKRSIDALRHTMKLANMLGVGYVVAHLGSHLGEGMRIGIRNVIDSVQAAIGNSKCRLLLENQAGQRNSVGSSPDELMEIYEGISSKDVGFCIDTCHIFATGYDIRRPEVMDGIRKTIGMGRIGLFHLNDAKYGLGSRKDRHANIGYGFIGSEGFRSFLGYRNIREKPFILETPRNGTISAEEELNVAIRLFNEALT